MFFKFITPEGLKSSATSIQSVNLCKVCKLTAQIAPFDFMGCNTGVFCHKKLRFENLKIQLSFTDV
jgi:hypothetical protein